MRVRRSRRRSGLDGPYHRRNPYAKCSLVTTHLHLTRCRPTPATCNLGRLGGCLESTRWMFCCYWYVHVCWVGAAASTTNAAARPQALLLNAAAWLQYFKAPLLTAVSPPPGTQPSTLPSTPPGTPPGTPLKSGQAVRRVPRVGAPSTCYHR